jgi:hypothetical protein
VPDHEPQLRAVEREGRADVGGVLDLGALDLEAHHTGTLVAPQFLQQWLVTPLLFGGHAWVLWFVELCASQRHPFM